MQNVLEYTGSKVDRQTIRKYEFHYANAKTQALKFDVLLVGPLQPWKTSLPYQHTSEEQETAVSTAHVVLVCSHVASA